MTAPASPVIGTAYLREAIADEATLARLLGWTNLEVPNAPNDASVVWGRAPNSTPTWPGAEGRSFVPRWRRANDAFELITLCSLHISTFSNSVRVACGVDDAECGAEFVDHPSAEYALRYAICQVAIKYLTRLKSSKRGP